MPQNSDEIEVIDLTGITESSSEDESEEETVEESEEEVILDQSSRAQLYDALRTLSGDRLRDILVQLIEQSPAIEQALTKELVSRKRKPDSDELIIRYQLCVKCNEEYDSTSEREEDECKFHPGSLEPDYDSFDDWDENVHGPINAENTRAEFPENFSWSCCDEDGLSQGCVRGHHEPGNPSKRRRMMAV